MHIGIQSAMSLVGQASNQEKYTLIIPIPLYFYYHAIKFKVSLIAPLNIHRIVKQLLDLCEL